MSSEGFSTGNDGMVWWTGALWRASWQGALFVLAVWAACRLAPRIPASIRCWLWWLACLKLFVGLVWAAPLTLPLLPPRATVTPASPAASLSPLPRDEAGRELAPRALSADEMAGDVARAGLLPPEMPILTGSPPPPKVPWLTLLLGAWAAGAAYRIAVTADQCLRIRRLLAGARQPEQPWISARAHEIGTALGLRRVPPLRESATAPGPLVVGPLRTMLVLPQGLAERLTRAEVGMLLAHELAHLRRGDLWLALVPGLAQVVFFFHPLVGLACREWETAREAACDAAALQATEAPAAEYGRMLMRLVMASASTGAVGALAATPGYATLRRRLLMLQQASPGVRRHWKRDLALLLALVAGGIIPWRVTAAEAGKDARGALADPAGAALRAVRSPCSLRKVCEELSARYHAKVFPDASLAEMRVIWAFDADRSLPSTLASLAELTDSRVVVRSSQDGRPRFTLERSVKSAQREAAWRTTALRHTIAELLRAADEQERGTLQLASFSRNVQPYIKRGRAPQLRLLRHLSPDQMNRLLRGEAIRLPTGTLPDAEVRALIAAGFLPNDPDYSPAYIRNAIERGGEEARRYGLALQIDFSRHYGRFSLMLALGPRRRIVLAAFGEEEVGLPLTRTNPYRLLESGARKPPPAALPPAFGRPLGDAVVVPSDADWETVLQELARVAHVDMVSDAYLSRNQSKLPSRSRQKEVLVPRGTTITEALDQVCRRFGYLWWEKEGSVYLRARAWVWDAAYEVPDRFLDTWTAALASHRPPGVTEFAMLASLTPLQLNGVGYLGKVPVLTKFGPPDAEGVRPYLQFFRQLPPASQARMLGPGLPIDAEQSAAIQAATGIPARAGAPQPCTLRLTHTVSLDQQAPPMAYTIQVTISRSSGQQYSAGMFSMTIPRLPNPFTPL